MSASLLVELFTEELPPKALGVLAQSFADEVNNWLSRARLKAREAQLKVYATPRRLAVLIPDVLERSPNRSESKRLMPGKVAFDAAGKPTTALSKRLEKEGGTPEQLERRTEKDVEYVYLNQTIAGVTLAAGLQIALNQAITRLPIPKVMSYQLADGVTTVEFVRPAHGLIALHGSNVVDVSVLGLKADRIAHGHRFQGVQSFAVAAADAYDDALAAHGHVIASFDHRRAEILRQLQHHAAQLKAGLGAESDYLPLLDEVTALVEYPTVYIGEFDRQFLAVPQECLILTMRQNQRYFPLFDDVGRLSNRFLMVSNMQLADARNIVEGNQRVIRPRLADARFFYETDRKVRLEERVPQLGSVVYHNKLGNQLERAQRVQLLTGRIARSMGADSGPAERAAWLAKADLLTNMVGEFPELQGIMGRYYALADGEEQRVAHAIEQHYRPRFAGDSLPDDTVGTAVALADKLETLAGMFGIGQQPTGEKDPYALRRHALGVIRLLIENELALSLHALISDAFGVFPQGMLREARADLQAFVLERLRGYLREQGYTANEVEAVLCMNPAQLDRLPRQLAAVRAFAALPEADSLAAANKRVANILRQAEAKGETPATAAKAEMLREPAERQLFEALVATSREAGAFFEQGDYTAYLKTFAVLKSPVDAFFDSVMVMVDAPELRHNRLALLANLRKEMNRIADISKLAA